VRVWIAEKPSVAQAVARQLGISKRHDGYIACRDGEYVTWCFGHLLEMVEPGEIDPEWQQWKPDVLPMIPQRWDRKPRPSKGVPGQVKVIGQLLRKANTAVNGGDPAREGQVIVDELLEYHGFRGRSQRLWLAAQDEASVRKAIHDLRDNDAPIARNRYAAGVARERADWLVGLNLTRALTIAGRAAGIDSVLSVGRVQTPTLALVVERDRKIENFQGHYYYEPWVDVHHAGATFRAKYQPGQSDKVDEQGRLIDRDRARAAAEAVAGTAGRVVDARAQHKRCAPPLPYALSGLQKAASTKLGLSASAALQTAQKLYERALVTYPRTDCQYLPEEQFADAPRVLGVLAGAGFKAAKGADASRQGRAWDTSKVGEHHAIVPTGEDPSGLSGTEAKVFGLIAMPFIQQFLPDHQYTAQMILVEADNGTRWKATGKKVIEAGWYGEPDTPALPDVQRGDRVTLEAADVDQCQTQPPSPFTDGSLIDAMKNVHKYIDDPASKNKLREGEGIGQEATRAPILETLISRGYLERRKKALRSTDLGREVHDQVPVALRDPVMTAQWESYLEDVANGDAGLDAFVNSQAQILPKMVELALGAGFGEREVHPCPECGGPLKRIGPKKKGGRPVWACSNREHPLLRDAGGKPGKPIKTEAVDSGVTCPECGQGTFVQRDGKSGPFWSCSQYPACKAVRPDHDGAPGADPDADALVEACPDCGGQRIRRESQRRPGFYFWKCRSNKDCPLRGDDDGAIGDAFSGGGSKKKAGGKSGSSGRRRG